MIRRVLLVASVVCALLCVGLGFEAVRGIRRYDRLTWRMKPWTVQFTSNWGCFAVWWGGADEGPDAGGWFSEAAWKEMPWELARPGNGLISTEWEHIGLGYASGFYFDATPQADGSLRRARFRLLAV